MRKYALFLVLAFAVAFTLAARPAAAQGGRLHGVWLGYYGYDDGRASVKMQARLSSVGSSLSGSTIEVNTFGDSSALFLTATIRGAADPNGAVSFVKTYDGAGGQRHSVSYAGVLDSDGRCVKGRWSIGGLGGPFALCADARLVS